MILHALLIAAFAARLDLSFVEPQSALQPCARGVLETNAIPVCGSSDLDVIRAAGTWFSGSVRADRGPLTFVLTGDGRELWSSGTLQSGESRRFDVCADGCGIVTYSTRGEGAGEWHGLECLYARGEGIRPLGERPAATYRESVYDGNPPWEDPRRFAENRESPHATRHLHCAKENLLKLDGDWKIKWVKSPDLAPDGFFSPVYDDSGWETIRLPETCETAGYGTPLFTNFGYYWTVDPPFVSRPAPDGWLVSREPNGTSLFRRTFDVPTEWKDRRTYLRFDGFLSAIEVWVNGRRVGYAQDGRQGAEFEITEFLVATQNLVAVRVLRICDGSYLEDQDYWRMSGLFRPVYLESRPKTYVRDFFVRTARASTEEPYVGGKWNLTVDVDVEGEVEGVVAELREMPGAGQSTVPEACRILANATRRGRLGYGVEASVLAPRLWSAEEPNLYELTLTLKDGRGRTLETLTRSVGFREVERRGCQMLVNGQPVMIKGVNRHEFDPDHGFALSDEQALEDLRMLKRYNVNAIRLCHYPANPSFYEMANRLGFYVMDEANCESHGLFTSDGLAGWMAKRNPLVHNYAAARNPAVDPRYRAQILDRVMGMVERDKNEPCVISWSLGNEQICQSDYFTQAYRAIRRRDPGRLVMNQRYGEKDMRDQMYEKVTNLVLYAEGKMEGAKPVQLPFILCEYNHTQGNSGGNLVDYRDVFMKYPCLQGGFTWDFIDQGIRRKDARGREYFAYGGEFGDEPNSGAGCLNGCFRPDRTPSPQMQEMKYCFQDVGVKMWKCENMELRKCGNGEEGKCEKLEWCFSVTNYCWFANLRKYEASWTCEDDGRVVAQGALGRLDVAPQGATTVRLLAPEPKARYLRTWNFVFRAAEKTAFCEKGFELAHDQVVEATEISSQPRNLSTFQPFNLSTSSRPCFFSALTEKSRDLKDRMLWNPKGVTLDVTNGVVSLKVPAQDKGAKDIYARVGVTFALPKKFTRVSWFGRGPGENYANRKAGAHFGRYEMPIGELTFPYEVPQESGNRRDVYELTFVADDGETLRLTAVGKPFAFTVSPYADEELASGKRHVSELVEAETWTVHIDDGDMGVGGVVNGLWQKSFLPVDRDYSLDFRMERTTFMAGFARIDLEPPRGLSLAGYFSDRPCSGVKDPVEATCVALGTDEGTALLYTLDLVELKGVAPEWKKSIAVATGVKPEAVVLACTHTHTAPSVGPAAASYEITVEGTREYDAAVLRKLIAVGKAALADRAPAAMRQARTSAPGLSFVRRYRMKDGRVVTNPGRSRLGDVVGPAGLPDDEVQVVRLDRTGVPSIALVNFQCHADMIGGTEASADWPGFARRALERDLGVKCAIFNGASGDTNHIDVRDPHHGYAACRTFGEELAGAVLGVWKDAKPVGSAPLSAAFAPVGVPLRKPTAAELAAPSLTRVAKNRVTKLAAAPERLRVSVTHLCFGDVFALCGFPCEPFTEIGREAKRRSSAKMTFVTSLTDGSYGYLPTADAYDEGAYETDSSIFASDAAQSLIEALCPLPD